jgi:hypothetical protein
MSIWGTMSKPDIAQDSPIDDRMTKIEETIKELGEVVSILMLQVFTPEPSLDAGAPESPDDSIAERTIWQNDKVIAALKILTAIPFTHDLDDHEMHECAKVADRIYRAKFAREKKLDCIGRLPAQRQILAWVVRNYRTLNPVAVDIHRFIDGLFRIADYLPTDTNWNFGETNARSFRWMDDALVVSVPEDEFPF